MDTKQTIEAFIEYVKSDRNTPITLQTLVTTNHLSNDFLRPATWDELSKLVDDFVATTAGKGDISHSSGKYWTEIDQQLDQQGCIDICELTDEAESAIMRHMMAACKGHVNPDKVRKDIHTAFDWLTH